MSTNATAADDRQIMTETETETRTFEFTTGATEQADVYVTETFDGEYRKRAVLEGDTYNAKEAIKFDRRTTHHEFDPDRKVWIVDADALDELEEVLADDGFTLDKVPVDEQADTLDEFLAFVEEGDQISVDYQKKNNNGPDQKTGTVTDVRGRPADPRDPYAETAGVVFDPDGKCKTLFVREDDSGTTSLFSRGYHPYMGGIESITVERETERDVEADGGERERHFIAYDDARDEVTDLGWFGSVEDAYEAFDDVEGRDDCALYELSAPVDVSEVQG